MISRVERVPSRLRHRISRPGAAIALFASAALLTGCDPGPGSTSPNAPATQGTTQRTSGPQPVPAEANIISGRVTTETGAPVAGARLRVVGYTGGASLGQEIETVTSGADGTYRYEVPRGLYEVLGEGPLDFDGQTYLFNLDPADGSCDQQMSDAGIVKDFVLRLQGLMMCLDGVDPDNQGYYHGAALQVFNGLTSAASNDVVEYAFEPIGPLADGSTGQPLTFQRTVAAHSNFFGPIDGTSYLYDIPLGRYQVSAALLAPDGSRQSLLVSSVQAPSPAQAVEVSFDPRLIVGTLSVGFSSVMPNLTVYEGG
ncbi:MAG TPA: carboxypeptidase-like regulatory domain-containing protein [Candidatus Limnocylindrales bacterium]|nr:carboxypeptidase-like regulatory domain-containing protein [Candidatus Limnocylindrales bacterium]